MERLVNQPISEWVSNRRLPPSPGGILTAIGFAFQVAIIALSSFDSNSQETGRPTQVGTAVPIQWTDPQIIARQTSVRAIHFTELRSQINAKRIPCGLPAKSWTDPQLNPKSSPIKKIHLDELRVATAELVNAYRTRLGIPLSEILFTDPVIESRRTPIKKAHLDEIRVMVANSTCAGGWSLIGFVGFWWDQLGGSPEAGPYQTGAFCGAGVNRFEPSLLAFMTCPATACVSGESTTLTVPADCINEHVRPIRDMFSGVYTCRCN